MKSDSKKINFRNIIKSKFVRSIFLRIVSVFLIVIIAVIAIVYFSFTSEINKNAILDRQKELNVIESTISQRMEEVASIAYNISTDKLFYLEPAQDERASGYEMSKTLSRYLVGNDFIEHLAYYRISEPDTIYVSSGELSFSDFWLTYMHLDKETADLYISQIRSTVKITVTPLSFGDDESFFAYTYPLPVLSKAPKAYVLMLIPYSEIQPIVEAQLTNCHGEVAVFDADENEIYRMSNLDFELPIDLSSVTDKERYFSADGKEYVMQTKVSDTNGWIYVSVTRLNDVVAGVAGKQLLFIALLVPLMLVAIFSMLMSIVVKYKPINNLALRLTDKESDGNIIDEETLISDTLATMQIDIDRKEKFEAAYYEAEAASKAKTDFLSNMSHDIRTPMNAIIGMTEIATKHSDDPVCVRESLQKVQVASRYLLDIINNILDMSKIESGKLTLAESTVELPKLVGEVITILNQSLEEKNQRLIAEIDGISNEKVIGDGVRLSQIFVNILSNSVKFTPTGGTISLKLSQKECSEVGFGDYVFVFSDTGIGMSPGFTEKVFEMFTRDKGSQVTKTEGTGLGMAIVKSFVDLMGGTISCESELGKGTAFTVSLCLRLAGEQGEPAFSFGKYIGTSVLVVGGESVIRENEAEIFRSVGAGTETAESAGKAAEMAKRAAERGLPYRYVLINRTADDPDGSKTAKAIAEAGTEEASFVLAALNLLSAGEAPEFSAKLQIPLFRSTAAAFLNGELSLNDKQGEQIPDLAGVNVLLAEDNAINREIAGKLIGETNASIVMAENGQEAVDAFSDHAEGYFGIVLMDVQMPVMNGYDATVAIRALNRSDATSVPIYAITANTFDEDVRQVMESGMNGHLGKPYTAAELYSALASALKKQQD